MQSNQIQLKKLTIRLRASIFLVFILLFAGIVFIYSQYVKAVFPTKSSGSTLTAVEWNALPSDIGIPSGAVNAFNLINCPTGWSPADGSGGTPDLRGMFIRGLNDFGTGARSDGFEDPDTRVLGDPPQDDSFEDHSHSLPNRDDNYGAGGNIAASPVFDGAWNTGSTGGDETRPNNIALIYCVKN